LEDNMAKAKDTAPAPKPGTLVATTGLDYLAADGTHQRLERGDQVSADQVAPAALKWMAQGGFLVAAEGGQA
jgi:hypothetical protein